MKYKLLVLDVDGTLLNENKEITQRTQAALLKAQQMGVHVVLASGRPTAGLLPLAHALELNNYGGFILSYNGGQIINVQTGELLFEKRIAPEMIPYLEQKAIKNNFAIFTYRKDTLITNDPHNRHVIEEAELNGLKIVGVSPAWRTIGQNGSAACSRPTGRKTTSSRSRPISSIRATRWAS